MKLSMPVFAAFVIGLCATLLLVLHAIDNDYLYFGGYLLFQYVALAVAWNILGGYAGYINFGSAAFMATGSYTTVVLVKLFALPLPFLILAGGATAGLLGLFTAAMTLRFKGIFFAIATLALAVVLQTIVVNWDFVGGSRGVYLVRPPAPAFLDSFAQYLFALILGVTALAVILARFIERSTFGMGLAAIRENELAAETCGVPTLRLKIAATVVSGALMGMAGAPLPYYLTYMEPNSAFALTHTVNSVAMPLIGGTSSWTGPVIGALLLGLAQQTATVTISSGLNLLVVGGLLMLFVLAAPEGLIGFLHLAKRRGAT